MWGIGTGTSTRAVGLRLQGPVLAGIVLAGALVLIASAEALVVKHERSRAVTFSGADCRARDQKDVRVPKRGFRIRPLAPAIGAQLFDFDTNQPVAKVVTRQVRRGGRRGVRFVAEGSDHVCTNPEVYQDWGWWTRRVRLRVGYRTRERVYVKFSAVRQYKPRTLYFGASGRMTSMRWRGWDNRRARGRGVLPFNDCVPYCAAGTITPYRVKVRLSRVRRCDDGYRYRKLSYRYLNRKPRQVGWTGTMRSPCWW